MIYSSKNVIVIAPDEISKDQALGHWEKLLKALEGTDGKHTNLHIGSTIISVVPSHGSNGLIGGYWDDLYKVVTTKGGLKTHTDLWIP